MAKRLGEKSPSDETIRDAKKVARGWYHAHWRRCSICKTAWPEVIQIDGE
jgi:hypothetical protein